MTTESQHEPSRDMLDYAWRYFSLHAGQRIAIFNFFVVLSGLSLPGLAACLQRGGPYRSSALF